MSDASGMPRYDREKPRWLRNLMEDIRIEEEEAPLTKAEMRAMCDQATAEFVAAKGGLRNTLSWLASQGFNTFQTHCPACGVVRCDLTDVPAPVLQMTREQIAAQPCACGSRLISADAFKTTVRKAA